MNILGFEITRTNGEVNWQGLRRLLYTAFVVWSLMVRLAGVDPFGLAHLIVLAWVLDLMAFIAACVLVYHIIETAQARRSSSK